MTATLSKTQAELPRLVEIASQGEDVVITVEGKPKARLTRAGLPEVQPFDGKKWIEELEGLNLRFNTAKNRLTVEQILAEDREDRF